MKDTEIKQSPARERIWSLPAEGDETIQKEAAEAAGMSKPSAGQIEYVELGGADTAVIYAAGKDGVLDQAFASVKEGVLALVEYFQ